MLKFILYYHSQNLILSMTKSRRIKNEEDDDNLFCGFESFWSWWRWKFEPEKLMLIIFEAILIVMIKDLTFGQVEIK